jgi:hypothetical protein
MQHLKQGCGLVRRAKDKIALEEQEGDAVAGGRRGAVQCLVCFLLRFSLEEWADDDGA